MQFRYILIGILILILGFVTDMYGFLNPVKNFLYSSTKTVLVGFNRSSDSFLDFFRTFSSIGEISRENIELKEKNLKLESENVKLLELKKQNEILKEQLGFIKKNKDQKLIPAQIIARPPAGILRYITLNKGKEDGIVEDNFVVFNGYLVGKVEKVLENSCQVLLINNNCLIPVFLQDSRATGILKGGLAGLVVEEVTLDTKIKKDEKVLTRALESQMVEGVLVGKVVGVISKQSEIFQKISISSPIDFNKLEFVFIIQ